MAPCLRFPVPLAALFLVACSSSPAGIGTSTSGGSAGAGTAAGSSAGSASTGSASSGTGAGPSSAGSTSGGTSSGGSSSGGATGSSGGSTGAAAACASYGSADLFVATDGNDSWSGTLSAPNVAGTDGPLASFAAARQAADALLTKGGSGAVVIQFRAGTYLVPAGTPLTLGPGDSGTAQRPIVYESYPGETPVFSGGVAVTGWLDEGPLNGSGPEVWTASVPAEVVAFEQLWVGGQRRYRPTSSVGAYLYNGGDVCLATQDANQPPHCDVPKCQPGQATCETDRCPSGQYVCDDRFQFMPGDLDPSWYGVDAGSVEIDDFEQWTMSRMRLSSVDGTNGIAYLTGATEHDQFHGFLPGHRYLAENVKEALTQPGQWYWDAPQGTLTYLAEPGEDLTQLPVVVPQTPQILVASGVSHVTFCGLTFSYGNWVTPAAGYTSPSYAWPDPGSTDDPASVSLQSVSQVTVDSCTFSHTGATALEITTTTQDASGACVTPAPAPATGDVIQNSLIYDVGVHGLRLSSETSKCNTAANVTQFATVQNNVIAGGGRFLPEGIGILMGEVHDTTVVHNEIYDFYSIGIDLGDSSDSGAAGAWMTNNLIAFNYLHDLKKGVTSDGGAIHVIVGAVPANANNLIQNNRIHDVTYDPGREGNGCSTTCTPGGPPCSPCYRGYGANGVYLDGLSQYVTVSDNLVYRVMGADISINPSAVGHVAKNNIFTFARQAPIARLSDSPGDLTFENNLVYWDANSGADADGEGVPNAPYFGDWDCQNTVVDAGCPSQFLLQSNLYWDTAGSPAFFTGNNQALKKITTYPSLSAWQSATGEDTGSLVQDPGFGDAGADDFSVSCAAGTPEANVGFDCASFQAAQAGLQSGAPAYPPPVPDAFPPQLPSNPATYY